MGDEMMRIENIGLGDKAFAAVETSKVRVGLACCCTGWYSCSSFLVS